VKQRFGEWLSSRRVYLLALALGFTVCAPSLRLGMLLDDYIHQGVVSGRLETVAKRDDLFSFGRGGDAVRRAMELGQYPWWTHPKFQFAFFRPLSTALINLDNALFGDTLWLYHLHSIAWYLLLIAGVGALFRRSLPPGLAGAAVVLFAIRGSHSNPILWLAARNGLVAAAPVVWGLWAHLRWREDGWKPGAWLAIACFAIGLSGGEAAVAALAYLAAYEAVGRSGPVKERAIALIPAGLLGVLYVAAHRLQGYGVKFSASYNDPLSSPGVFLANAPGRALAMLGGDLLSLPVDFWVFGPAAKLALGVLGAGGAVMVFFALRAMWPTLTEPERRTLKWLTLGAALSLLPAIAGIPALRTLIAPSIGSSAVLAVILRQGLRRAGWAARSRAAVFAFTTLVLGLLMWPIQFATWGTIAEKNEAIAHDPLFEGLPSRGTTWIFPCAPDFVQAAYLPVVRLFHGLPMPDRYRGLSMTPSDHRFTRTGERSFELEPIVGSFISDPFAGIFRDERESMAVGQQVALPGFLVTVLAVEGSAPRKISVELDRPLEDPTIVFLTFEGAALRRWSPPAVGASVLIQKGKSVLE
jgi:hypothetical protein